MVDAEEANGGRRMAGADGRKTVDAEEGGWREADSGKTVGAEEGGSE
jgi:hypothetical protein